MQDTGYIGFYPGSRIPNLASIGAEMAQTMINAFRGFSAFAPILLGVVSIRHEPAMIIVPATAGY
jgi:hypothetical protein